MLKIAHITADSFSIAPDGTQTWTGNVRVEFAPSEKPTDVILAHVPSPVPSPEASEEEEDSPQDLPGDLAYDGEESHEEEEVPDFVGDDVEIVDDQEPHEDDDAMDISYDSYEEEEEEDWRVVANRQLREDIVWQRERMRAAGVPYPAAWDFA